MILQLNTVLKCCEAIKGVRNGVIFVSKAKSAVRGQRKKESSFAKAMEDLRKEKSGLRKSGCDRAIVFDIFRLTPLLTPAFDGPCPALYGTVR